MLIVSFSILHIALAGTGITGCSEDDAGICQYCNSTAAQQIPLAPYYKDICRLYPNYTSYQPVNENCTTGNDSFIVNNPCCPQFPTGSRILDLMAFQLQPPFTQIPVQCNKIGSFEACNNPNSYNGQYCNKYNFCSFLSGTIISSASSAAKDAPYTQCSYKFRIDADQMGTEHLISNEGIAAQQFIIPYVTELAQDTIKLTQVPSTEPTSASASPAESKNNKTAKIIGDVVGVAVGIFVIVLIVILFIKKRNGSAIVRYLSDDDEIESLISEQESDL